MLHRGRDPRPFRPGATLTVGRLAQLQRVVADCRLGPLCAL